MLVLSKREKKPSFIQRKKINFLKNPKEKKEKEKKSNLKF